MDWRGALAHRCASVWWRVAGTYLQHIDGLFRAQGFVVTIDMTDLVSEPESRLSADGSWLIRMPLSWFPLVYSTALSYCEVEDVRPGATGDAMVFDEAEAREQDPIEHPLAWHLPMDLTTGGGEPKYWMEALVLSVDALMMVTMHELAHCLLGHHRGADKSNKPEMRAVEVEADTLAGIFAAALDKRTDEQRKLGFPIWNQQQAEDFARAANLLRMITRWHDSRANVPDASRSHHRATPRYHHFGLGALIRFNAVNPSVVPIIEEAVETVPNRFAFYAMLSPLEKYAEAEPESDEDWAAYEKVTAPLVRELSQRLSAHRVPVLATMLAGFRLQTNTAASQTES